MMYRWCSFVLMCVVFLCSATAVHAFAERQIVLDHVGGDFLATVPGDLEMLNRGEALQAIMEFYDVPLVGPSRLDPLLARQYFSDVPQGDPLYWYVNTACLLKVLACDRGEFAPDQAMTVPALFTLLYNVKYRSEGAHYLAARHRVVDGEWYSPAMEEAYSRNILSRERALGTITRNELFYILYKEAVLEQVAPEVNKYFYGLVYGGEEITTDRFYVLEELQEILESYKVQLYQLERQALTETETYQRLREYSALFATVHSTVLANPLYYDTRFHDVRERFAELGIREVIGYGTYDFSRDAPYRKHNVRTSLEKFQHLVIAPGEEFNYWSDMRKKGFGGIQNGWLLIGTQEVWGWGGGLCGTATAIFRAAWHSGMEITERRAHTVYYTDLYDRADVGLDAAVFMYSPNLRFRNPTSSPIMMYIGFNERRDVATVYILGQKHFESISFSDALKEGRTHVRKRFIEYRDGRVEEEAVRSNYRNL